MPASSNPMLTTFVNAEVQHVLRALNEKKVQDKAMEDEARLQLLKEFLTVTKNQKEEALERIQRELKCVADDIASVDAQLREISGCPYIEEHGTCGSTIASTHTTIQPSVTLTDTSKTTLSGRKRSRLEMSEDCFQDSEQEQDAIKARPKQWMSSSQFANKQRKRLHPHLPDLQQNYYESRMGVENDTELLSYLDDFSDSLVRFSKYSRLRTIAHVNFADGLFSNNSSIVSSIEFDKDDEFFATAGVSRRIKIFDYASVISDYRELHSSNTTLKEAGYGSIRDQNDMPAMKKSYWNFRRSSLLENDDEEPEDILHDGVPRFPVLEMSCHSKISSLAWNEYFKSYLMSSDYEGLVTLWDSSTGTPLLNYDEHEKRTWSVDWNKCEPTQLASGGDDNRVKLWSTNQKNSVATIHSDAHVCSVKFNPGVRHQLAFAASDHTIQYYDLRKFSEPLHVFKGHTKAVSYVKFRDRDSLVSASTDCTLRMWSVSKSIETGTSQATRIFSGHSNEKNFVGLSIDRSGDLMACGSETNDVFVYWSQLSKPIVTAPFGRKLDALTGQPIATKDPAQFVSSVTWMRNTSGTMVAANSQGRVKVMELL
ncbi:RING finger and WD repeat domain-containing protein 2 [Gaertneriomyces sp. JEL0708]|nr:RING finger and WD repeat domain-containing protein 2 [Gaertneriomyces sp. JEL0708]